MSKENAANNIDLIMQDPKFLELALKVMEVEEDIDDEYLIPFEPDETDEDTGASIVKTRRGDYGKDIDYIPVKYIRKRLDLAFKQRWSFFIIGEHRETEPFQRWSKNDNDWLDGDNYIKCIGMMVVPGLGIRMEYGVKKVFGNTEASDWKACKTDAFKKCAEAFGIYLNYADDDEDEGSSSGRKRKGKGKKNMDLSDVEYTDEDLEDALEYEISFGKYSGSTLQEIMDEEDDQSYIEWLADNANDDDLRELAAIVLKYYEDQEGERSNRRSKNSKERKSNSSKDNKSNKRSRNNRSNNDDDEDDDYYMNPPEDDNDEDYDDSPKGRNRNLNRGGKSNSNGRNGRNNKKSNDEDDDERDELIDLCQSELDNYDRMQSHSMMASVSVSNKYPKGKTKLSLFTDKELHDLAEVLGVD